MGIANFDPEYQMKSSTPETLIGKMAMESVASEVMELFRHILPRSREAILTCLSPVSEFAESKDQEVVLKSKDSRKLMEQLKQCNFMTYQDTMVLVPEGFEGNLAAYLETLYQIHETLLKKSTIYLNEFTEEIAIAINTKSLNVRFFKDIDVQMKREIEHEQAILAAYFKKNSNLSRQPLKKVASRFADFETILGNSERLATLRRDTNLKQLLTQVNRVAELLDVLNEKITNDDSFSLEKPVALRIASSAHAMGRYIEMVSVSCFNIEVAMTISNALAEQFMKLSAYHK